MSWFDPLRVLESRGKTAARPGSLAGLASARRAHLGQFFTPDALAALLWRLAAPAFARARARGDHARFSILDNSVGSGRLLQFANPEEHHIAGVDVDAEAIKQLIDAADAAGFSSEFWAGGMELIRPNGFNLGLINPPFSLHLEGPTLEPYPCTAHGRFGPCTSAASHAYALHQALDACEIVLAIVPRPYAAQAATEKDLQPRLCAIIDLPAGSFREEGTEVSVSVLVFDTHALNQEPARLVLKTLTEETPDLGLDLGTMRYESPRLRPLGIEDEAPSITLPVTGDRTVRIAHNGRRIKLFFACGLVQAKVLNAILDASLTGNTMEGHRYPSRVRYLGEGVLDIEVHLGQENPQASFDGFIARVRAAGGDPHVDRGLANYLKKRICSDARARTPFRHVVYIPNGASLAQEVVRGKARETHLADPNVWGSPLLKVSAEVEFRRRAENGEIRFEYTVREKNYYLGPDELHQRFEITDAVGAGWAVVHEGKAERFPDIAAQWRARAKKLNLDAWLSWQYQFDDLVELSTNPNGAVVAWDVGLGKARLAAALCLISGSRNNLIVVEPQLVPEMVRELMGLPIDPQCWQVIHDVHNLRALRQINIIAYNRLRGPVTPAHPRRTFARLLRRRIGVLVADEGHLLRNPDTQQSRALAMLSARRRYVLTATPAANYPRDVHALICTTGGDGTATQAYGFRGMYLEPVLRKTMYTATRGIDRFREDFVTLEWCVNEFAEDNRNGAKREVPKLANVQRYRAMLAPHVLRRVHHEPEVAKYIHIPEPTRKTVTLDWDPAHLAYYLKVADEFRQVYADMCRRASLDGKKMNLIALLARIRAVQFACSYPQHGVKGLGAYAPLTSKQRYAIDRLTELSETGRKAILYADNPGVLDLLARHLRTRGISPVVFHGKMDIETRTQQLDAEFRFGNSPTLLASLGVTQTGLNIPQADTVLFYNRAWTAKTETQAGGRVLRPQQTNDVNFEYLHLKGSIDLYQGQMVAHKFDSIHAGLDWGTPELDAEDFLHIDTILGRFCDDLEKLHGCRGSDLRTRLATA